MSITVENIDGSEWFKIEDYNSLRPFFISLVSDSNHWLFISSNGGVTARRKNPQFALFPYYTDDKIVDLAHTTGSKTILQVPVVGDVLIWEPFSERDTGRYEISRFIYSIRMIHCRVF